MAVPYFLRLCGGNLGIARLRLDGGGRASALHFFQSNFISMNFPILTTVIKRRLSAPYATIAIHSLGEFLVGPFGKLLAKNLGVVANVSRQFAWIYNHTLNVAAARIVLQLFDDGI